MEVKVMGIVVIQASISRCFSGSLWTEGFAHMDRSLRGGSYSRGIEEVVTFVHDHDLMNRY